MIAGRDLSLYWFLAAGLHWAIAVALTWGNPLKGYESRARVGKVRRSVIVIQGSLGILWVISAILDFLGSEATFFLIPMGILFVVGSIVYLLKKSAGAEESVMTGDPDVVVHSEVMA